MSSIPKGSGFDRIPLVDIAALRRSDANAKAAVAAEIGRACREVGFLYVTGHGVRQALIDGVVAQARRLYALPDEAKRALYIGRSSNHRGYVPPGEEVFSDDPTTTPDSKEGFDLARDLPADDPDYVAGNRLLGPNVWPDLTGFREAVTAYYDAAMGLGTVLFRGFALALGLEEGYFDRFLTKPTSQLRLLHYPPRDAAAPGMGIGAHTDYECFTILYPTEPGLQVMNADGRWIDAPPIPGAFVINIGDMMEAWTNGRFIATAHRVVSPPVERFSFPLFCAVDYGTLVEPLPACVSPDDPPRYAPRIAGEHLLAQTMRTFRYLRDQLAAGTLELPPSAREDSPFGRKVAE
ncbi:MAG TPA: 2-oxoglutarate and iron-dependent oxygenase domain-containing protein [Azospirillum sp.]|nr:2-oxoglutarate and iron-dependent oxygenase domain-containing protein [Azospirillum sp.]